MKSKEMCKMIDKYVPMMVALSEINNDNSEINMIEIKAAAMNCSPSSGRIPKFV